MEYMQRHYLSVDHAGAGGTVLKITDIEVGWGFTKNIGNYESERAYIAYTCQVAHDETPQEVLEKLEKMAKVQVKRIIKHKIEKRQIEFKTDRDDLEDYY